MALGFGSLGERPQAAAGQGASSSKSYPSKDRKRGSCQQQVTEESPQRESLSDSIEDEPPGCRTKTGILWKLVPSAQSQNDQAFTETRISLMD